MYFGEVLSTSKVMSSKDWDMLAACICGVLNVMVCVSTYHYMFSNEVTVYTVTPTHITTYSSK